VLIFRILDPSEIEFGFQNSSVFYDTESGRELYVDPESVRRQYQERFETHAVDVRRTCSELGIDLRPLTTDQPLSAGLFDFLSGRQRFNRLLTRRRANTGRGARA
jgi:hypothetical protein